MTAPIELPQPLATHTAGARWHQDTLGRSGMAIYRLDAGTETCFLKMAQGHQMAELQAEAARIQWLQGRLSVPEIVYEGLHDGTYYLLMRAIPGRDASKKPLPSEQLTQLLAEGLRSVHAVSITDCPFDRTLDFCIAQAQQRVAAGLVDTSDFDDERLGRSAEAVFEELLATRPATEDLVFVHGDYCLPNIMVDAATGHITGYIDLGRAGIADRHHDIAIAAWSVAYNLGAEWVSLFYETYGLHLIDPAKIAYYQLLDEFF